MRCLFTHDFRAYEEDTADGGYVQSLRCERCGETQQVAKVTKKGADIQGKLDHMRKNGYDSRNRAEFSALLDEFRREVKRL